MRVLLIDAFPMVRAALTGLIQQHFAGAEVQGVDGAASARAALAGQSFELALMDLRVGDGLALLEEIHREHVTMPVIVVSGSDQHDDALRALGAGAMGYVPERSELATLAHAMNLVLAGGTFVPSLPEGAPGEPAPLVSVADWADLPLTPRQKDVLRLLKQGLPNKLIAREMGVSVETVKDHVAAVLRAMGVSSRTQAVVAAAKKPAG